MTCVCTLSQKFLTKNLQLASRVPKERDFTYE